MINAGRRAVVSHFFEKNCKIFESLTFFKRKTQNAASALFEQIRLEIKILFFADINQYSSKIHPLIFIGKIF